MVLERRQKTIKVLKLVKNKADRSIATRTKEPSTEGHRGVDDAYTQMLTAQSVGCKWVGEAVEGGGHR
jgi:hypothetical protein